MSATDIVDDEEQRRKLERALVDQAISTRRERVPFDVQDVEDDGIERRPLRPRTEDSPTREAARPAPNATPAEEVQQGRRPGQVDPGLAFMAAFSQNPVLAKMVEDQRSEPEHEQQMQLAKNRDAREQQKADLEQRLFAPLKAQGMQQKNALGAAQMQAYDPAHPYSQAMRQGISQRLAMEAERMPDGAPLKEMMKRAASGIASNEKLNASQAIEVAKQFGGIGDRVVKDAHDAASMGETQKMNEAKRAQMSDQSKQAWARINAAREKALAPRMDSRARAAQVKNQEKLDDEIEKADWARNNLLSIADLKQHVNTGPLAGRFQNALQNVDMSSPEFNAMKQRLAMVSNRIIKELSGSAVTGNEWSRMQDELANIMNDDSNFDTKLANMIELTDTIKQRAINRYARNEEGKPTNPTNTAAMSSGQKPKTLPGEQRPAGPGGKTQPASGEQPKQNTSSRFQIGQTATNKKTGEQVQWDGEKWVKLK